MSEFALVSARISIATDSDAEPYEDTDRGNAEWEVELTPDEVFRQARVEAALTSGTAIATSVLNSCTLLAVRNRDVTNFVTLTWRSAANSSTDNKVKLLPGQFVVLNDVTAATNPTIVADTAVCLCDVVVLGT